MHIANLMDVVWSGGKLVLLDSMRDVRDVCVVVGLLFVHLSLLDDGFMAGAAVMLVFIVLWNALPSRMVHLLFALLVPVLGLTLSVTSMIRHQKGSPGELVVFLVALSLAVHQKTRTPWVLSVGGAWTVYTLWSGAEVGQVWFLTLVGVVRMVWEAKKDAVLDREKETRLWTGRSVARTQDCIDALHSAVWERKNMGNFVLETAVVALFRSDYLSQRLDNLDVSTLELRLRNMVEWSQRWGCRLLGMHGDIFIFLCPPGSETAIHMMAYMADLLPTAACVVDIIRLPVQITDHGLQIELPSNTLNLVERGHFTVGHAVQHSLGLNHRRLPNPEIQNPPAQRHHFEHVLERHMDMRLIDQPILPLMVDPLWSLVAPALLFAMGDWMAGIPMLLFVGAAFLTRYLEHPELCSIVLGFSSAATVLLTHGSLVPAAVLCLIPGSPSVVATLVFASASTALLAHSSHSMVAALASSVFLMRRTMLLVLLAAVAGYSVWCVLLRDRETRTYRATAIALLAQETRVGAQLENIWKAHVPDVVEMDTRTLDGWMVLRDMGPRVVAYCPSLPAGVHPQDHVIHCLTGGCWIISREELDRDVQAAVQAMEERVGLNATVEVCSPRVLVFGGAVLFATVFGPARAKPPLS